jgi:hypothetical protein
MPGIKHGAQRTVEGETEIVGFVEEQRWMLAVNGVVNDPGRGISGWWWGGVITVCEGRVGGALMEREQSSHDHVAAGGSSRLTSLTNESSKPSS